MRPLVSADLILGRRPEHRQNRTRWIGQRHCRESRSIRNLIHTSVCAYVRARVCVSYHSPTRPSRRSSVSSRRTTESDGHTDGCCRAARCRRTPLWNIVNNANQTADRSAERPRPSRDPRCSDSQQLASSTSRGQSGKPSQIMVALMHTLLPGHSHRARSVQPARHEHASRHRAAGGVS